MPMIKFRKKVLAAAMSGALVLAFCVPTAAIAATVAPQADEEAVLTAQANIAADKSPVLIGYKDGKAYGMVNNRIDETTTVDVRGANKYDAEEATADGKVDVTLVINGGERRYGKIALMEQASGDDWSKHDAAAIKGDVTGTAAEQNFVSTFKFQIGVDQIGERIPITLYYAKNGESEAEWYIPSSGKQLYFTAKNTPAVVDQMVNEVAVQGTNEYTDLMCETAGKLWKNLSADQQKDFDENAENAGWFSEDTGDASKDKPLAAAPSKGAKEILVVSFGTSFNGSRAATIGKVEAALQKAYPDYQVRRAFTSQIIINHIHARDGEVINNMDQAMELAIKSGVKELIIQPTTLMSGAEYKELSATAKKYSGKISYKIAKPLLNSTADKKAVMKAAFEAAAKANKTTLAKAKADKTTAYVFMGHGTSDAAKKTYTQMQTTAKNLGYTNVFIGTVEGNPEATSVVNVFKAVKKAGYKKVVLRPLMIVAGDHANNDMAGDDAESWKSAFVNGGKYEGEGAPEGGIDLGAGFGASNVKCQVNGLGEIATVQSLFVSHTAAIAAAKGKTFKVSGATYKVTNASTGTVALTKGSTAAKPSVNTVKYAGKTLKVTAIGAKAYSGNKKVTSVTLGANVQTIGASAFAKTTALKSFTAKSKTLKTIGASAFNGAKKLKTLNIAYTTKLTKKGVKNSLKGSSVKTVNVKNSLAKTYRSYFAKSNSGKVVTVK